MAGVVQIPWYVTTFRGDQFEEAIQQIAPLALRYGATDYSVHRSLDDRYKFTLSATFESHTDFERYWYGEEFSAWRADYAGWFQIPIVYGWAALVCSGRLEPELNGGRLP
jgi:hypothetical protein